VDSVRQFLEAIGSNRVIVQLADRLSELDLPDAWLAGGCLFQTAWNVISGEEPTRAIKDYDVFYFDADDLSAQSEEAANHRAAACFADLGCSLDVRNQARVHLWYAREFGVEGYPRLTRTTDGIDHFLAVCCMIGARRSDSGELELYAPLGVEDILSLTVRPNPWFPDAPRAAYAAKVERWRSLWPALQVWPQPVPAPGRCHDRASASGAS
jgi:hypothetical protein